MAKREITGQHVLIFGILAVIALSYFVWHPLGWGAPAPAIAGGNSEVLMAISGVEKNLSEDLEVVNETAKAALVEAKKANQTASTSKPVLVTQTGGQTSPSSTVVASATNTMDDKALNDAKTLLAKANRIASDAERFKREARDLDSDEEDDASDLEEDIKDSKDERDEVKEDIADLQDTIYQDWSGQGRNETAKNLAGQALTEALDALSSAKEDYKDATSDVDDILDGDEEETSSSSPQVVYVTTPAGQTTTAGVTGYQSQTEGL